MSSTSYILSCFLFRIFLKPLDAFVYSTITLLLAWFTASSSWRRSMWETCQWKKWRIGLPEHKKHKKHARGLSNDLQLRGKRRYTNGFMIDGSRRGYRHMQGPRLTAGKMNPRKWMTSQEIVHKKELLGYKPPRCGCLLRCGACEKHCSCLFDMLYTLPDWEGIAF